VDDPAALAVSDAMSHKSVLFLCTGNYYRSRFAAILFNHLARERGLNWSATSRGMKLGWPGNVGPLSPHTEKRLGEMAIAFDDARHMPRMCSECDLVDATLVVALKEKEHRPMLAERFGNAWADRVTYWHVHDVDKSHPDDALREIEALVRGLIRSLPS
jgi:protein-tyrosine phosphatase